MLDSVLCAYRIAETALLPVLVCAEGFLLSHTSEVLDLPDQETVDAFLPPFRPPADWVLDPGRPRTFAALPEPRDYYAFQRHVADAHDGALGSIEGVAADFTARFGRRKVGALDVHGDPDADTALVTIGTIGDTARELLADDDDLLLVRVHAFRPFPAAELAAVLARASRVVVVDRAPAFGSLGPLGGEVRALGIDATTVVAGLGGMEVTPATLRWALEQRAGAVPVYAPEDVA